MKKVFSVSILILLFTIVLQAQDSDYQLIEKTLSYYLEGGTNNDFEMLEKAFHPTATMKFVGEKYKEVNAVDFFRKAMKPGPKQDRQTRIVSISMAGNAANAQIEIMTPTVTLIDFMNLLKIDGGWKIVSKIFAKTK